MDQIALKATMEASPDLTLSRALRLVLERCIVSGELEPGVRINENSLAASFNVNRAALREALTALGEDGLVEFVRNRGAYVRGVGLEDALHLYDVRAGLARTAGRLLALRTTPNELRQLDAMHAQLLRLADAEDIEEYDRLNIAFHHALIEFARNPPLMKYEEKVARNIRLYLREGMTSPQTLRVSCREHATILDAVKRTDAEAAGLAFEVHVLNGKQRMLEIIGLRRLAVADGPR